MRKKKLCLLMICYALVFSFVSHSLPVLAVEPVELRAVSQISADAASELNTIQADTPLMTKRRSGKW